MNRPKITLKRQPRPEPTQRAWRYTNDQLLHQALEMLRMTRAELAQQLSKKLHASEATMVTEQRIQTQHIKPDGQPAHVHTQVWSTSTHLVETTRYGHVRKIQKRPRNTPEVRVIRKPGVAR